MTESLSESYFLAVTGMACRFPGASDVDAYWRNLIEGRDAFETYSAEELAEAGVPEALRNDPDYVPAGTRLVSDFDRFDAGFFGFTPREAEITDPQHRVFLETAWHALEHAGVDPESFPGLIGVFAGMSTPRYLMRVAAHPHIFGALGEQRVLMGNKPDTLCNWVSYKLNLRGPSLNVQTTCSTSMAAVHQAGQSLLNGECDLALAGGVCLTRFSRTGHVFREGGIMSPDGRCRAFDARANGTMGGNGVGLVTLQRLDDAIRDGSTIYAVLRGSFINNDGAGKIGFTAPGVDGQAAVIREALRVADVDPREISYVEAHGTGTTLGDPVEVSALTKAFDTEETGYCALGSVKTNIGHLDTAAGVAGLIKTVLALHHKQIPPSLGFSEPNPRIDFAHSPFFVNAAARDWASEGPRRAGVSSFGIGGTNIHAVLEEAPEVEASEAARPHELLVLSAETETAFEQVRLRLASCLSEDETLGLGDVAATLRVGRKAMKQRGFLVADDREALIEALTTGKGLAPREVPASAPPLTFSFPGQGSQRINAAKAIYAQEAGFRKTIDRLLTHASATMDLDFRAVMFPEGDGEEASRRLERTELTQPALYILEVALGRLWMSWGLRPQTLVGHSIGEYAAAALAGVFSLEDGLDLVIGRGELIASMPGGDMLAVQLSEEALAPYLTDAMSLAAVNAAERCVVSGPAAPIADLAAALTEAGVENRVLRTSHAFHSSMMDPILEPFRARVAGIALEPPKLEIISCLTAEPLRAEEATDPDYWVRQLRGTVRFGEVLTGLRAAGHAILEVGPGQQLTGMAKQTGVTVALPSLPSRDEPDDAYLLKTVGRLWCAGFRLNWRRFDRGRRVRRVPLPAYPFERDRYWLDFPEDAVAAPAAEPAAEVTPAPVEKPVAAGVSHRTHILDQLKALLHQTFGIDPEGMDIHATFFELGVDSLLMLQAVSAIKETMAVEIPFRYMFEELSTLDDLAGYLAELIPPEPEPEAVAVEPETGEQGALLQQLNQISGQLETIRAEITGTAKPKAPLPIRRSDSTVQPVLPFKSARGEAKDPFTAEQRAYLDDFIARYTAKTAESKRRTQADRVVHADPRTSSGFNQAWKGMIYRIMSSRSKGSRVWDVDGNEYIDLAGNFGVNLLGHNPDFVVDAIRARLDDGIEVGPQSDLAGEAARLIHELTGVERVAFSNTGSEAVMNALRIARTVTNRSKVVMFLGSYHGTFDGVLARPKPDGTSMPLVPGTPSGMVDDLIVLDYGTPESLETIKSMAGELAAVLIEPIQSRRPDFFPVDFLTELRTLADEVGFCYIFDEVVTGFRYHPGGAQALTGIEADVVIFGKIAGGGMPIGVVAGKPRFLDALDGGYWSYDDDSRPYALQTLFAGTFCKHPLAMAASIAVLRHLAAMGESLQEALSEKTARLAERLEAESTELGVPLRIKRFRSLFRVEFAGPQPYPELLEFFLLYHGLHVWEGGNRFLTTAHTDEDLDLIVERFMKALSDMVAGGLLVTGEASPAHEREKTIPLTEGQYQIWISANLDVNANRAYNETTLARFTEAVDTDALARALQALVARHEALRLHFAPDGKTQSIRPELEVGLTVVSLEDPEARAAFIEEQSTAPFDLVNGPLIRASFIDEGEGEGTLLLVIHHLIIDAWSFGVVNRELFALYEAMREGRQLALPETMQFSTYVERATAMLHGGEGAAATEAYWLEQLEGAVVTELPTDRPRPRVQGFSGRIHRRVISPETTKSLEALCARENATLFVALLAVQHVLMRRLCGVTDTLVGVSCTHQPQMGQQNLVGFCLQLMPFRAHRESATPFTDFLAFVKRTWFDAFDHQLFSLDRLLDLLEIPANPSRHPLYTTTFNLDPGTSNLVGPSGGDLGPALAKFDISFNIGRTPDGLVVDWTYNSDLFDPSTMERWLGHFQTLIEGIVAEPELPIGRLPIMSEAERDALVIELNQTETDFPDQAGFDELVAQRAMLSGHRTAAVAPDETLSYSELVSLAHRIARHLVDGGVRRGDVVGVYLEARAGLLAAFLGILEAGATYLPLDPSYPPERLAFMMEDCAVETVITLATVADDLPAAVTRTICLDTDAASINARDDAPLGLVRDPEEAAYVIYTSGSTGKPKGVVINHRSLCNLSEAQLVHMAAGPESRVLQLSSLNFDASILDFALALRAGAALYMGYREDLLPGPHLAAYMREKGITHVFAPPSAMSLIPTDDLPDLEMIVVGGESSSEELIKRLKTCCRVLNIYGPTEATVYITCHEVDDPADRLPIGSPIGNARVYVLDRCFEPVPYGVVGELYLAGAGLARCYLNRPALTAAKLVPDPFGPPGSRLYRSGDLVEIDLDNLVYFVGRVDHQVKIRGFRVEPGEIEARLESLDSIATAHVRPDEAHTRLLAYVVPGEGGAPSTDALRDFLAQHLPEYLIPARFFFLDELPITANGKLDAAALPKPDEESVGLSGRRTEPRNETERHLAMIWREQLQVDELGIDDNFFALGGDSIIAIQITARANREGLVVTPRLLLENQTVASLAKALAGQEQRAITEEEPVVGPVPLTPIQRWFLAGEPHAPHHFTQGVLLETLRTLDPVFLEQVTAFLIQHHDALRARFLRDEDGWHQTIVEAEDKVPFSHIDLSTHEAPSEAVTEAASRYQASFDLEGGPLFRMVYFSFPEGRPGRLLVLAHHLVVDGVSWRILLDDLQIAYGRLDRGEELTPLPKTTSFAHWSLFLNDWQRTPEKSALPWLDPEALGPVFQHPEELRQENTVASQRSFRVHLSREETEALLTTVVEVTGHPITAVLLTSLGQALSWMLSFKKYTVFTESHGRPEHVDEVDLTRTVGWLTSLYPIVIDYSDDRCDPLDALDGVAGTLREVPDLGLGYGARYFSEESTERAPEIDVVFNYLGRLDRVMSDDSGFAMAPESMGPARDPEARRPWLLEVNASVIDGCMRLVWTYSENLFEAEQIEMTAETQKLSLTEIIEAAKRLVGSSFAPGRFTEFGWDRSRLTAIRDALPMAEDEVEDVYPLALLQHGMLFHSLLAPDSGVYVFQVSCGLEGRLDREAFDAAFKDLIATFPIMRTCFAWSGLDEPVQLVRQTVEAPIRHEDWSSLEAEERDRRWQELIIAEHETGFQLDEAPLMRVRLVRMGETTHRLAWSIHHLLLDGWSMQIVFRELFALYQARSTGMTPALEPRSDGRDHARWLALVDHEAAERFWCEQLGDFSEPTPLAIPERPDAAPFGMVSVTLSEDETSALTRFARENALTLNTVFQGAWSLLLSRYSGRDDVVFGTTSSGRPADLEGAEDMVGLFINTLPTRVRMRDGAALVDWLRDIQETYTRARQYEYVPLARVQSWSGVPRGTSMFETIYTFESYPLSESTEGAPRSGQAELVVTDVHSDERPHYPVSLMVNPGTSITINLYYDGSRFDRESLIRMGGHLEHLLTGFLTADVTPDRLALMPEHERAHVLSAWNQTEADYSCDTCFNHLFAATAAADPEAPAVIFGATTVTYGELARYVSQLAHHLVGLGIGPESRVGVYLDRSVEAVVAFLAILEAGGTYVPLDSAYPADRLAYMIETSGVAVIVTLSALAGGLPEHAGETVCLDESRAAIEAGPATRPEVAHHPDNSAYLIFTSGSTGKPKGVMLAHRGLCNLAEAQVITYAVPARARVLQFSSLSFDASVYEMVMALRAGATLCLAERERLLPGAGLADLIEEMGVTHLTIPPSALAPVPVRPDCPLEVITVAGEACPPELVARWIEGRTFFNAYGPTETTVWASMKPVPADLEGRPSIGYPISNFRLHVVDAHLEPRPLGLPGELCIGGPGLARGYLARPAQTALSFVPDPFGPTGARLYRSGDLVRYAENGELAFLGRIDQQIKLRGFRIEPGEIESALKGIDGIDDAVVLPHRRSGGDQMLAAYLVVPTETLPAVSELRAALEETLPGYMVPDAFVPIEAVPLTPNGKLDRAALPDPNTGRARTGGVFVSPESEHEQKIAAIWQEVLEVDRVGLDDNFFDLGGQSLLMVRLHASLQSAFAREIPLADLFEATTVRAQAELLTSGGTEALAVDEIRDRVARKKASRRKQEKKRKREWKTN